MIQLQLLGSETPVRVFSVTVYAADENVPAGDIPQLLFTAKLQWQSTIRLRLAYAQHVSDIRGNLIQLTNTC